MGQDLEKAESRLQNVQAVSPILGALRTISLGNWQVAINKRKSIKLYNDQLINLLPNILPHIKTTSYYSKRRYPKGSQSQESTVLVVGLGTERGLCGRYNNVLAQSIAALISDLEKAGNPVSLGVLGSRLLRSLVREGSNPAWVDKMPINNLPTYDLAFSLVSTWFQQLEKGDLKTVVIAYNKQEIAGRYQPWSTQLIPPVLPEIGSKQQWPPYIVETDPVQLYTQVVIQWTGIQLYNIMLEAAITEHAARFQLMESATQNAERLVEELTISIQNVRRQEITRELQELAIGAGLVG